MRINPTTSYRNILTFESKKHKAPVLTQNSTVPFSERGGGQKIDYKYIVNSDRLEKGQFLRNGLIANRATTSLFRDDLYWDFLADYITEKYKNDSKVNIYDYACSSGEEAYTLAILLKGSQIKPERFFPIIAKDIRQNQINENNCRKAEDIVCYSFKDTAKTRWFEDFLKDNLNKYAKTWTDIDMLECVKLKPALTDKVKFEYGNILEDIDNIDNKNPSMIFCRNMWEYVDKKEYDDFCKKLYGRLAPNSCVILGYYDIQNDSGEKHKNPISDALIKAGFEPTCPEIVKSSCYPAVDYLIFEKGINLQKGQILIGGEIFVLDTTYPFRGDLNWDVFGQYIKERFNNAPKVNIYNYACSDGSEPYSLAMIIKKTQDKPSKFFPIVAKDIDPKTIRTNIINQFDNDMHYLDTTEYHKAKYILGLNDEEMQDYMTIFRKSGYRPIVKINPKIMKKVKFEHGNILEDFDKIDNKNPSLVMCRNMWPYVDRNEYKEFAKNLYDRLAVGSSVVIGYYDIQNELCIKYDYSIVDELINAGFTPAAPNVANSHQYPAVEFLVFEKN